MLTTQICFADSTAEKAEEVINADLANVDKWYEQNGMKRNTSIYQAIVIGNSQVKPQFYCENTAIPITGELEYKLKTILNIYITKFVLIHI